MTLRCRDTGGYCNWEGRADTEEKLIKEALRHASEAHYMKRTQELEEAARRSIRDEEAGRRSTGGAAPAGAAPFHFRSSTRPRAR